MGAAQRNPSNRHQHHDGLRLAPPILRAEISTSNEEQGSRHRAICSTRTILRRNSARTFAMFSRSANSDSTPLVSGGSRRQATGYPIRHS
jgi:hypothetical protein